MRLKGWVRAWIVATALAVPLMSGLQFKSSNDVWGRLDKTTMELCVDEELGNLEHKDAIVCAKSRGAYQDFYSRENISPALYWSESLGAAFLVDCILTFLLAGCFFIARWIVRGFGQNTKLG